MFLMSGPLLDVGKHKHAKHSLSWRKQGDGNTFFRWDSLHAHLEFWMWIILCKPANAVLVQSLNMWALEPVRYEFEKSLFRGGD